MGLAYAITAGAPRSRAYSHAWRYLGAREPPCGRHHPAWGRDMGVARPGAFRGCTPTRSLALCATRQFPRHRSFVLVGTATGSRPRKCLRQRGHASVFDLVAYRAARGLACGLAPALVSGKCRRLKLVEPYATRRPAACRSCNVDSRRPDLWRSGVVPGQSLDSCKRTGADAASRHRNRRRRFRRMFRCVAAATFVVASLAR